MLVRATQRPRRNVELNKRGEVGRLVEGKNYTFIFFMKMVVRDRAMQITDIVNIESLALALRLLALTLALAFVSLALLTSLFCSMQ